MKYGATITGIGAYVPENRLTNADLTRMVDTSDEWIVTRTGIRERRIAPREEGTSHLAVRAAREALQAAGLRPEDLDLILVATSTPDLTFPPVACLVQGELGAGRAPAFDVNGVCAGFLTALVTGAQFIGTGTCRHVLVIGADTYSRIVDYTDRSTCILFGDGAGAVVLSRTEPGRGLLDFTLAADGREAGLLYCPHPRSPAATLAALGAEPAPYIRQHGQAVFKAAVSAMAEAITTLLERQGLVAGDLAVLVPHQANLRLLSALAERIGLPEDRVAVSIEEHGNTSAASIPLALHRWVHTRGLHPGDLVMFTAVGGGLLWGAALMRWG
ncbi:MAG: ketoacyl-ACP synthase III [Firmicutes bacterium]|nr:ketoacyl-ACP synthase III [Bacillota bacterium]